MNPPITYTYNVQEYPLPTTFLKVAAPPEVLDLGGPPFPVLDEIQFEEREFALIGPSAPQFLGGGLGEPFAYYIRTLESGETPIGQSVAVTAVTPVLGLVPIPQRTATNPNLRIFYTPVRGLVNGIDTTAANTPDLPLELHTLIPRRMCVVAATAEGLANVQMYQALYNSALIRRLGLALRGQGEGIERVEITDW